MMATKKQIYTEHVHAKLLIRQRLFFALIAVLMIISIRAVLRHTLNGWLALTGFFLSIFIGLLFSRIFKIHWSEAEEKVVSKLDAFGIILLVLYIGLDTARTWAFKHWLTGAALSSFGLIFLTGILLGRYLGINKRIRAVLQHQNKFN